MATQAPDGYDRQLKQQILSAFGFASEEDIDLGDGYAEASRAYHAEYEAFRAELPDRLEKVAREATELLRARGALPQELELAWALPGGTELP